MKLHLHRIGRLVPPNYSSYLVIDGIDDILCCEFQKVRLSSIYAWCASRLWRNLGEIACTLEVSSCGATSIGNFLCDWTSYTPLVTQTVRYLWLTRWMLKADPSKFSHLSRMYFFFCHAHMFWISILHFTRMIIFVFVYTHLSCGLSSP